MKAGYWVIGGFALLGMGGMIEVMGDAGTTARLRLPLYLASLACLLGASMCFYMALRKAMEAGIDAVRKPRKDESISPIPAARIADGVDAEPAPARTDFDPDAVIARYLEQRGPQPDEVSPRPAAPASPTPPRSGFGRKVV